MIELPLTRVELSGGIALDTVDVGPRDSPALLFLHGFPESHRTWRHQIAHFSGRFRCIAPDQRGYGGSSKPQDVSAYATDRLIADLFQLTAALGLDRFTVVGHDWGGAIAWGVALLGQGRQVERAIIANAPHPALFEKLLFTDPVQRKASQYIRAFRDPANDALIREHGLGALLAKAITWDRPTASMEPEERADLFARWQDRAAAFAMLNWYRASPIVVPPLDAPMAVPDGWTPPSLPPLRIPTLVIWAVEDEALPACNIEGMADIIDPLTLVPLHGCGHFVPWEAPDAVNAAMEAFLPRG